jgi:hypothetical protein
MGNVKIGSRVEVGFVLRVVEQLVEGGWGIDLFQGQEEQQFAKEGCVSVLPAPVAEDLWLQGGGQPVESMVKGRIGKLPGKFSGEEKKGHWIGLRVVSYINYLECSSYF